MKFKLNLEESLFDDDFDVISDVAVTSLDLDDDFSDYEDDHSVENVLPGPAEGADTGVAGELIALINDEWEAVQGYNNAIATIRANISANPFYERAIKVLEEISAEENTHVGQLQEILKHISPNAAEIQDGTKEARNQLGLVGGKLPVQSWDSNTLVSDAPANELTENMCTLNDIDDEM